MMQSHLLLNFQLQVDTQSASTSTSTTASMSMHTGNNSRFLPSGISFQNQVPERESSTVAEFAKDAVIVLLLGTVGLICLMLVTYLLTIMMDRLSPYYLSHENSSEDDANHAITGISPQAASRAAEAANRDIGTLTRKAHLWGLQVDERESVLRAFFQERTCIFGQSEDPARRDASGDIEMGDKSTKPTDFSAETLGMDTSTDSNAETNDTVQELASAEFSPDAADMHGMCCICLLPYEEGESVMTGTQCGHLYHFDCCQAWLAQHDHCPYCRQEMLRPAEFRQAAFDVLGETRVNQLLMQHYLLTAPVTIPPTMVPPPTSDPTISP